MTNCLQTPQVSIFPHKTNHHTVTWLKSVNQNRVAPQKFAVGGILKERNKPGTGHVGLPSHYYYRCATFSQGWRVEESRGEERRGSNFEHNIEARTGRDTGTKIHTYKLKKSHFPSIFFNIAKRFARARQHERPKSSTTKANMCAKAVKVVGKRKRNGDRKTRCFDTGREGSCDFLMEQEYCSR